MRRRIEAGNRIDPCIFLYGGGMGRSLDRRTLLGAVYSMAAGASGSDLALAAARTEPPGAASAFDIDGLTRQAFFNLAPQVEGPPDRGRIRKLLGNPDEIWRIPLSEDRDPAGISVEEIWRYGVEIPNGLATLGEIQFDSGWATLFGGRAKPPSKEIISESKLRVAMSYLFDAATHRVDPLHLIRCVNLMQPLGKKGVLAVLEQFSDVVGYGCPHNSLILLMRILFEPPHPTYDRPWVVDSRTFLSPDHKRYPRFPMDIVDGVPICVFFNGGGGSGPPAMIDDELPFYRKSGKLRGKSLRPPDDPFIVVEKLLEANPRETPRTREWTDSLTRKWGEQILDLVRTAYRPKRNHGMRNREPFSKDHADFAALKARWSERHQLYVRADGTFEPLPRRQFEYPDAKRIR